MAVRRVRILGDPVLRQQARAVEEVTPEILQLAHDLGETMLEYRGVGLAATQVGELHRVIAVFKEPLGLGDGVQLLINPVVQFFDGRAVDEEGCLSIPGLYAEVERPAYVEVEALEVVGDHTRPILIRARDYYARVLLHEIDHLDGILFTDRMEPERARVLLARWRRAWKHRKPGQRIEVREAV